ncbi:hypothetical protein GCM10025866_32640 [Naasia aerilata]|uniref:Probable peptidoglycan glycosyltransferase FtsW n=2 Tax=Naasia aerilata TaxID=1162966 RepID=A0ABN6XUM6_9MICO|nr:hypothetical protein GCM10025866_32640 [Naasia aerilata]
MAARISLGRSLTAESSSFFLLLGTTLFLVAFGLVMVLSSSSVESFVDQRNSFSAFLTQGGAAVIGVPLMLILSRLPPRAWKVLALPALAVATILQLLVFTPLGYGYGGNRNWLDIGFMSIQPSEVSKVALVLWLGQVLSARHHQLADGRRLIALVVPVAGVLIGLVLIGRDLGTALIMAAIVFGGSSSRASASGSWRSAPSRPACWRSCSRASAPRASIASTPGCLDARPTTSTPAGR